MYKQLNFCCRSNELRIILTLLLVYVIIVLPTEVNASPASVNHRIESMTPLDGQATMRRGEQLLRQGQFKQAVVLLKRLVRFYSQRPTSARHIKALIRLGEAQQALGRYVDASETLNQALQLAKSLKDTGQLYEILYPYWDSIRPYWPRMETSYVYCNKGQSLADVVAQSQKYSRIVVRGEICQDDEPVVVRQDNIVIDGNGAVLDGRGSRDPVIIVQARNVVIRNLTVTRGAHGIVIEKQATAVLKNVNANRNRGNGIVLGEVIRIPNPNRVPETEFVPIVLNQSTDNSLSTLFNGMLEKISFNMSIVKEARAEADREACQICPLIEGIDPIAAEFTTFCGIVNANDNGESGVPVNSSGTLEICGNVNTGNTEDSLIQQHGLAVHDGSTINIYGFATAQNNLFNGVLIQDSSTVNLFGDGIKLSSIDNQGFDLTIGENNEDMSQLKCHATSKLNLTGNDTAIGGYPDKIDENCFLP